MTMREFRRPLDQLIHEEDDREMGWTVPSAVPTDNKQTGAGMVEAEANLVTFHHGPFSGRLNAQAEADAVADFDIRRGIRFAADARASVQAHLDATLGGDPQHSSLVASVNASLGASTRVALAAQMGVNGVWAEACAAAEARAQIRGDVAVTGQMLLDALAGDVQLPAGALVPARAFLREVQIRAGVYAEAYFAVRARARAMVVGSVIPPGSQQREAGFSVAFDYGYAYIWGAGFSGFVDVDLPDVPRVLGAVVDAVLGEVLRLIPPEAPERVVSLLRLVVPLASAAAVEVGRALGGPQSGEEPSTSEPGSIADPFLEALTSAGLTFVTDVVLQAAVEVATAAVEAALDAMQFDSAFRAAAEDAIGEAQFFLDRLEEAQSFIDALPDAVQLLGPLVALADAAPDDIAEALGPFADAVTVACVAAGVLEQVLGTDPMPGFPAGPSQRVRRRLSLDPAAPVTVVHLVEYLGLEAAGLATGSLESIGWLMDVLGGTAPSLVAQLWGLRESSAGPDARRLLASRVLSETITQITTQLRPFLNDLPDGELKELAGFLEPLMEVLEVALQGALTSVDVDPRAATRLRDELDTLLTGVFGAIVVRCLDSVIRPFFARGQQQLEQLAQVVDRNDPAFAGFFQLANRFDVVFRITPTLVSAMLREMAGVLPLAENSAFDSAVELMTVATLLPADSAQRRHQLAVLAGSDDPTVGDARLGTELLDALFVQSTEFAVGMIPPSIRMSTLIALEQGPVPVLTLFEDARTIGVAAVTAIERVAGVGGTIAEVVEGLINRGKVRAEDLRRLGVQLRALVAGLDDLVLKIIQLVKDLSWPAFVLSTGLVGALLREQFDDFFDKATWLVGQIRRSLDGLVDTCIEAMITLAQNVGVLDTGSGDDLGTLGQAVRQQMLGDQHQPGLILLDGGVEISHAELATMVVDAAFQKPSVRDAVRDFHARAVEQQRDAREAALLLQPGVDDARQTEARLRASLTAVQRDTGFSFTVSWPGLVEGGTIVSRSRLEVAITGADLAFVSGPYPLVRIEIGGWPAAIDPVAWWVDEDGVLRGQFIVIADPLLGTAHPVVGEGFVNIPPQAAAQTESTDRAASPELVAVRAVMQQQAAVQADDPAEFLGRPVDPDVPSLAANLTADQFLPPVLRTGETQSRRFPAVLALDRGAILRSMRDVRRAAAIAALPGTIGLAFVSATAVAELADAGIDTLRSLGDVGADDGTAGRPRIAVVARARPGYITVTATVRAVPKGNQDADTTPHGAATSWFILTEPAEPGTPPAHDDAEFISQDGVPDALRTGTTAQARITLRNTGNTTWTTSDGYWLGSQTPAGNTTWGSAQQHLPTPVAPGETVTFAFTVPAPPPAGAVFAWQMVREQPDRGAREWFGPPTPAIHIGLSVNDALFVGQNVPSTVPRLTTAPVSVSMRNIGTTSWTPGAAYRLGAVGDDFGSARHELAGPVPPGDTATFTFSIPPPPRLMAFQWQMVQEGVEWFGGRSELVQVTDAEPLACADLRMRAEGLEAVISQLQEDLSFAAPGEKPFIARQIRKAQDKLESVRRTSTDLGCQP